VGFGERAVTSGNEIGQPPTRLHRLAEVGGGCLVADRGSGVTFGDFTQHRGNQRQGRIPRQLDDATTQIGEALAS